MAVYQPPQPIYYAPVISSFTTNQNYVQAGQQSTLVWNVNDANSISISPSVGPVAASGSFAVIPAYTTTYTLTATNNQGSVSASTTVTVAPYVSINPIPGNGSNAGTAAGGSGGYPGSITPGTNTSRATSTAGVGPGSTTAVNPSLMYLLLISLLGVSAIVITSLLVRKPSAAHAGSQPGTSTGYLAPLTVPSTTLPATATMTPVTVPIVAGLQPKFVSAAGATMPVTGLPLGRRNLQALMPPEKVNLISRQHIRVTFENGWYQIEDLNSTNGTKLNGSEIKGSGKHAIADGDTVEIAGAMNFTFKV